MSNANITIGCQCQPDIPLEGNTSIYLDEDGILKQINSNGCVCSIYCIDE